MQHKMHMYTFWTRESNAALDSQYSIISIIFIFLPEHFQKQNWMDRWYFQRWLVRSKRLCKDSGQKIQYMWKQLAGEQCRLITLSTYNIGWHLFIGLILVFMHLTLRLWLICKGRMAKYMILTIWFMCWMSTLMSQNMQSEWMELNWFQINSTSILMLLNQELTFIDLES